MKHIPRERGIMALPRKMLIILPMIIITLMISGMSSGASEPTKKGSSIEPWNFAIVGDTQHPGIWDASSQKYTYVNTSNPVREAIITSIVENNPEIEFILHTGDMTSIGGEQEMWDRYYEDIESATQRNISFYYTVGNHEKYTYPLGYEDWGEYDEDFSTYIANVELPGNERFYSFDYEDQIHFVFINTEEYFNEVSGNFEITAEQESWLINDLESNTRNFTIVAFHRPTNGWMALGSLLEQYGVDLAFSGHDHVYRRINRTGVMYVTTGSGGGEAWLQEDPDLSDDDIIIDGYSYCVGTVTELNDELIVKIDMISFDDKIKSSTLGDTFEIIIPFTRPPGTTETSEETSSSTLSETSTETKNVSSFPSFTVLIGIITVIIMKKRRINKI
jgi:predicted phosphodiesterase